METTEQGSSTATKPGDALDRACAGFLCVGFEGTTPSREVRDLVRRGVNGVVLFSRNIESAEQVAELVAELKRVAGRPLLVAVDQEGGRVARLRSKHGFTELPPMRAVGARGDPGLARQIGELIGQELRAVGIDMDFAPVVDVDTNPQNPVIGDRSFGSDPALVARMGSALAEGLQAAGVAACAKHFPGHGDTSQDSHLELPRLSHPLSRLEEVELPPFAALAKANVASMMTAHVIFEALDPRRPATLSQKVLSLLRKKLGFEGCILSDDLEMKAVAENFPLPEAVPAAVNAGVDSLLVCQRPQIQHATIEIIRRGLESGKVSPERFAHARLRVNKLLSWAGPAPDPKAVKKALRTRRHLQLAEAVAEMVETATAGEPPARAATSEAAAAAQAATAERTAVDPTAG